MTIGSDSSLGGVILARFLIKNDPIFKKTKFLEFWGPKWAQKYPILLVELLEMAITTFPAILSQICDGSIFVKFCKGTPLEIFTKIDPSPIWPKIAGKVDIAISSNSTNKIGYF